MASIVIQFRAAKLDFFKLNVIFLYKKRSAFADLLQLFF